MKATGIVRRTDDCGIITQKVLKAAQILEVSLVRPIERIGVKIIILHNVHLKISNIEILPFFML